MHFGTFTTVPAATNTTNLYYYPLPTIAPLLDEIDFRQRDEDYNEDDGDGGRRAKAL